MNPELSFLYVDGAQIGYGRTGVYLAKELAARGITVYNDDGNPNRPETSSQRKLNGRYMSETPTNLLCYVSVPTHMIGYFKGQHRSFVTMWESMTMPEDFRQTFHEIDTLIVPSIQNVELFSEFHDNVHYMPLGVDPELWHYIPPSQPERFFNFMISGRGSRKGNDLAFKAFRDVFRSGSPLKGPEPRLIMKSLKGHSECYGVVGVDQVTGKLSALEERDLYASAHCYLQPSRGEGFGLQPLQAIALGRPTILTNGHGHASFADLGIGLGWEPSQADYFIYGDAGMWWEPSYDELCEAMWDVYQNWGAHADRAKKSAEIVAEKWSWSHVTDRFVEILGDEMVKPYTGDSTWTKCDRKLYSIVMQDDWACDIAGRRLIFDKGVEYYESSDVKRTLYDAGMLDPVCCTESDHGLTELQVIQLGAYRASHRDCPTCLQPINSVPTRADEIEVEMLEAELEQAYKRIAELENPPRSGAVTGASIVADAVSVEMLIRDQQR